MPCFAEGAMLPLGPHTLCWPAVTLHSSCRKQGSVLHFAMALVQAACAHCSGEAGDPQYLMVSG